jgi:hypothetical protein
MTTVFMLVQSVIEGALKRRGRRRSFTQMMLGATADTGRVR